MISVINNSKIYSNGSEWDSLSCGKFTIIGKSDRKGFYICRFRDGTIVEVIYNNIRDGYVRNPNYKYLYNIGYIGQGKYNSVKNKVEYVAWSEMIRRCYNKNEEDKFIAYKDVTVCDRWHSFQNFCIDSTKLKNYKKWLMGGYHLDKDIICEEKGIVPKIYSPETCMFLTRHDNISEAVSRKNLTGELYLATRIIDGYEETFKNQLEFSNKYNLSNSSICMCLKGNVKQHKGWKFKKIKF